jgi:putative FmdB family regulatory protein
MPTYEFLCQRCEEAFASVSSVTEYERRKKKGIKCPKCGSSEVVQEISGFQVKTSKKS